MVIRFLSACVVLYIFNSITGYVIHDVLLHRQYMELMPVLHTENIQSKIWAFIVTSVIGSFFFVLVYSAWKKTGRIVEGLIYGLIMGCWIGLTMSLNTYASTGFIPFSLAAKWFLYGLLQYAAGGILIAWVYHLKFFTKRSTHA
ncbi:hypothetical protein [Thermoflavifilum thermophilum]|uniref:Uncharacterized protein n=1 Tax=Thermoflavifilum thermophilum TaxID=1393122 RepID=A0A1I7N856_9BACT|nr:hypothetical protein [Thermoflavifilum thermophilum]SFV30850.1 hypothetical protein SAMN05660895_0908 [Thermoflavifilum thermophilum]